MKSDQKNLGSLRSAGLSMFLKVRLSCQPPNIFLQKTFFVNDSPSL